MKPKLKRLKDQVIVITGASSGIGLATAEMAVQRGARVVLAARSGEEMAAITARLNVRAERATSVVADVASDQDVQRIADHAVAAFGGFDTWVNNAGISIYGRLTDVPLAEKRRLFDVNFWGVVHGCKAAVRHLRSRGGVIINVGSVVSDFVIPLQGIYAASKHAVKGYTDALRMELEEEGLPIRLSLVKPAAIDTPFPEHARKHMPEQARHMPPVYRPEEVAHAILHCAEKPMREVVVGGGGRLMIAMANLAPRLTDLYFEKTAFSGQKRTDEGAGSYDALYSPSHDARTQGRQPGYVMRTSAYTRAAMSDVVRAAPFVALGAAVAASVVSRRASAGR
jgi:short-subunit dehydrogenase